MEENLRILKPFIRGSLLIVLAMVLGFMAAKKYLNYVVPMYQSTTKLKLADLTEGVSASNLFKDFDIFASANKIATEIEVIQSSVLLNKALDGLDFDTEIYRKGKLISVELYEDSPFSLSNAQIAPEYLDRKFELHILSKERFEVYAEGASSPIEGIFGDTLSGLFGSFSIVLNEEFIESKEGLKLIDVYEFEFLSRERLLGKIKTNLDVKSVEKDVAVIRISYKNQNPLKAAKLVNRLAQAYIQDYIEIKYKAAESTSRFLNGQINNASRDLENVEMSIENYKLKRDIVNNRQETETQLRKVAQLKIQQSNLKMNLQAIAALDQYIQKGQDNFLDLAPNFEAFNDLLSTEIIKKMKELQSEKKELLTIFTPKDEKVAVIDKKLEDYKQYLTESIRNTKATLQIKYDNLSRDIDQHEQFFRSIPERERVMKILDREFNLFQQNYITLNEKKIEAEIAKAAKMAFHRVISPAQPSKQPVSPNRPIILIVSSLAGMLGAMALIYLVHLLKAKVNDKYTIESNSAIPVSMQTPKLSGLQRVEEHFLVEAGNLEVKGLLKKGKSICFTAFDKRDGLLFNAYQVAHALALQGRKVLMLDIENALEMYDGDGDTPMQLENGLHLLSPSSLPYLSMTKKKVNKFLKNLGEKYEVVIVVNELLGQKKSLLMMSLSKVNFVVLDTRLTPAKKISQVNVLMEEFQLPNLHFILNRFAYNPSVVKELFIGLRKLFRFGKKRRWIHPSKEVFLGLLFLLPVCLAFDKPIPHDFQSAPAKSVQVCDMPAPGDTLINNEISLSQGTVPYETIDSSQVQ
jgi:uncharacterized protein involved in exopolysaccharide biosynthesis